MLFIDSAYQNPALSSDILAECYFWRAFAQSPAQQRFQVLNFYRYWASIA